MPQCVQWRTQGVGSPAMSPVRSVSGTLAKKKELNLLLSDVISGVKVAKMCRRPGLRSGPSLGSLQRSKGPQLD